MKNEATEFIAKTVTLQDITFARDCDLKMQTRHVIARSVKMVIADVGQQPITYDLVELRCDEAESDYTYDHPHYTDSIESQAVFSYVLDLFGVDH